MGKINFSQKTPNNKIHYCYNDGLIYYGVVTPIRDKETREKIGELIEEKGKIPFSEMDIRERDNILADSLGYTIDMKIRVPFFEENIDCKVKINQKFLNNNNENIYDIVKKDIGTDKQIYLFLQIANKRRDFNDK